MCLFFYIQSELVGGSRNVAKKQNRLTIRHIVADDWKSIKAIWMDFRADALSQYDKPHNTDDEDVRERIAKWVANSGREHLL